MDSFHRETRTFWTQRLSPSVRFQEHCVSNSDGTRLAVQEWGDSPFIMVLVPSILPAQAYGPIVRHFESSFRFVTWHTRGTFGSGEPGSKGLSIEALVSDLFTIVQALQLTSFTLVGWGLSVPIILEFVHQHPQPCEQMVLVNGAGGHPLNNVPSVGAWVGSLISGSVGWPRKLALPLAGRMLGATRQLDSVLKRSPLFRNYGEAWLEVGRWFTSQPPDVLAGIVRGAQAHSSYEYLPSIEIPCLVTCAPQDILPAPQEVRRLAQALPDSTLFEWERGGHYAPVLQASPMLQAMEQFFAKK